LFYLQGIEKKTKLNNYTIQHNETKSIDRHSYIELKPYMSNNVNINGATDRTGIKCHKIYKDNRESLNKLVALFFLSFLCRILFCRTKICSM